MKAQVIANGAIFTSYLATGFTGGCFCAKTVRRRRAVTARQVRE